MLRTSSLNCFTIPLPCGTPPSTRSSFFVLHNSRTLFWERDRYSETNTHDSYTIHPSAMEPSGCALCLTKPVRVFINLSKKNIHWACTVPAISTSSTKCTSKCTWMLRILVGKCSANRHTVLMASSFARTIVDGLISLQDIHLKVQGCIYTSTCALRIETHLFCDLIKCAYRTMYTSLILLACKCIYALDPSNIHLLQLAG